GDARARRVAPHRRGHGALLLRAAEGGAARDARDAVGAGFRLGAAGHDRGRRRRRRRPPRRGERALPPQRAATARRTRAGRPASVGGGDGTGGRPRDRVSLPRSRLRAPDRRSRRARPDAPPARGCMRSLGACALALGACFSPNYADRFPCGPPPNECPSGYACTNGQCGKNGGATIDAPIGPTPHAPLQTGTLRVKVYALDGSIGAGITVAFHDPSGATVGVKTTDAAGEAQGQIVAGGGVTVGLYDASQRPSRLRTVRGVKPGQTITFGRPAIADALVQTAVVPPPGAAPAGTTGVSIEAGTDPCVVSIAGSAPPGPVPVPIRQHCVAGATYAVVAYAEDATHKRLGFSAMRGIPTGTAAVSLPPWQTTFATFQVNLSNAPAATMAPCVAADAGPVCVSAR